MIASMVPDNSEHSIEYIPGHKAHYFIFQFINVTGFEKSRLPGTIINI